MNQTSVSDYATPGTGPGVLSCPADPNHPSRDNMPQSP